ncbi:MAG: hypothetical protein LUD46_05070 [Parabacteroides sp.]|nr:hypothetical protein [Parabacteroides sp.]
MKSCRRLDGAIIVGISIECVVATGVGYIVIDYANGFIACCVVEYDSYSVDVVFRRNTVVLVGGAGDRFGVELQIDR